MLKLIKEKINIRKNYKLYTLIIQLCCLIVCITYFILNNTNKEDYVLIKSLVDSENTNMIVNFNIMNTSEDDYNILREKCDLYIDKYGINNSINLDTNVIINETQYADKSTYENKENSVDNIYASSPIYFQDKLLMQYINDKGEMTIIVSAFNNDKISVYDREKLVKAFNIEPRQPEIDISSSIVNPYDIKNEKEYINDIINIFVEVLKNSSETLTPQFKKNAIRYFTIDGYDTIIESKNDIKVPNDVDININIAVAGKSKVDAVYKDRVFLQLEISKGKEKAFTNIIIKLDNKYRVFDIDIV